MGRPSLRWDPADYRPHVLRGVDQLTHRGTRSQRCGARTVLPSKRYDCSPPFLRAGASRRFDDGDAAAEVMWPIWDDRLELGAGSLLACRQRGTEGRQGCRAAWNRADIPCETVYSGQVPELQPGRVNALSMRFSHHDLLWRLR